MRISDWSSDVCSSDLPKDGGGAPSVITGPRDTLKRARKLRSEMSLPERMLWRLLRGRPDGFKFRRQHPAGIYILDFYCPAVRLAIEVDGRTQDRTSTRLNSSH